MAPQSKLLPSVFRTMTPVQRQWALYDNQWAIKEQLEMADKICRERHRSNEDRIKILERRDQVKIAVIAGLSSIIGAGFAFLAVVFIA